MLRGNCHIMPMFSTAFEYLNVYNSKTVACTHLKNRKKVLHSLDYFGVCRDFWRCRHFVTTSQICTLDAVNMDTRTNIKVLFSPDYFKQTQQNHSLVGGTNLALKNMLKYYLLVLV
jgi:hypothetical protein